MADNGGPLNFRRGLDEIQTGNAMSADSQNQKAQMISAVGQRYSDSVDKVAQNVSRGTQGAIQSVQASEEMRMKRDLQRQQMDVNDLEIKHKKVMLPLEEAKMKKDMEISDETLKGAQFKNIKTQYDLNREQEGDAGADAGIALSYKGTKPADWDKMTTTTQAAWVKSNTDMVGKGVDLETKQKELEIKGTDLTKAGLDIQLKGKDLQSKDIQIQSQKLGLTGQAVEIEGKKISNRLDEARIGSVHLQNKLVKGEIASQELGRQKSIIELNNMQAVPAQTIRAYAANPESVATFGLDKDTVKAQQEKWKPVEEKAKYVADTQLMRNEFAELLGVKPKSATGVLSEAELSQIDAKQGTLGAALRRIQGDPNQKMLEAKMVGMIEHASKAGGFPLKAEYDFAFAQKATGTPGTPGFDNHSFLQSMMSFKQSKANTVSFFGLMNQSINKGREEVKREVESNDGFRGISPTEKANALYSVQGIGYQIEGKPGYKSRDDFAKLPVQQQVNAAFGFDQEHNKPVYNAPRHWEETRQTVEAFKDPQKVDAMVRNSSASGGFTFSDPSNAKMQEQYEKSRRVGGAVLSSPQAVAGVDASKGSTPATGGQTAEQVNAKAGSTTTPVILHDDGVSVPGYKVVSQPSGKAAAGATPTGKQAHDHKTTVLQKYNIDKDGLGKFSGAFK